MSRFQITSSGLPQGGRVVAFCGSEGISRPYRFDLFLQVQRDVAQTFEPADGIHAEATFTIGSSTGAPTIYHGILAVLTLEHAHGDYALFRAVLVPRLW